MDIKEAKRLLFQTALTLGVLAAIGGSVVVWLWILPPPDEALAALIIAAIVVASWCGVGQTIAEYRRTTGK